MSLPCPDCFSGHIHSDLDTPPRGVYQDIHSLRTYVASPPDGVTPKGIVVFLADAFGLELVNNLILADRYAEGAGVLVYVPDYFAGHAMPVGGMALMKKIMTPSSWFVTLFYKPLWVLKAIVAAVPFLVRNRTAVVKPRVFSYVQALRTEAPPFNTGDKGLKIGAAGVCFGGRYAILLAADTPSSRVHAYSPPGTMSAGPLVPLIDCAFAAHPSMVSVPDDILAATAPLSVTVGEEDMAMKAPLVKQMRDILEKKGDDHECVILPGAKHGFAIRTDPEDKTQMGFAVTAEKLAVGWFLRWFS